MKKIFQNGEVLERDDLSAGYAIEFGAVEITSDKQEKELLKEYELISAKNEIRKKVEALLDNSDVLAFLEGVANKVK